MTPDIMQVSYSESNCDKSSVRMTTPRLLVIHPSSLANIHQYANQQRKFTDLPQA